MSGSCSTVIPEEYLNWGYNFVLWEYNTNRMTMPPNSPILDRAVGSKNVVVGLIDYNNERTTGVSVESYKNHLQTV